LSDESLEIAIETLKDASRTLGFGVRMIPGDADDERVREAHEAVRQMDEQLRRLRAEARRRGD
jgi:hypothetical protein